MKLTYITILLLVITLSAFSQQSMIAHRSNGTVISILLQGIDSVIFIPEYMVPVAGGVFTAGSTTVTIGSFKIDISEVTYDLWTSVRTWGLTHGYTGLYAGANGYYASDKNNPVVKVNWYDVIKWCNARSEKDGLTPVYYTTSVQDVVYRTGEITINNDAVKWAANGYRLPTEAEWQFAARGGNSTHGYTYSGSNTVTDVAWIDPYCGYTINKVGRKIANELGIYDMSGNVQEWCWDWYDLALAYPSGGTTDPKGPSTTQSFRILRGGYFQTGEYYSRVNSRNWTYPSSGHDDMSTGFRCIQK